jgi:hypothetical protein
MLLRSKIIGIIEGVFKLSVGATFTRVAAELRGPAAGDWTIRPDAAGTDLVFVSSNGVECFRIKADGTLAIVTGIDMGDKQIVFTERADPAAPAANKVVVYAKDSGAAKTQLAARFPTGAVQVPAVEP